MYRKYLRDKSKKMRQAIQGNPDSQPCWKLGAVASACLVKNRRMVLYNIDLHYSVRSRKQRPKAHTGLDDVLHEGRKMINSAQPSS